MTSTSHHLIEQGANGSDLAGADPAGGEVSAATDTASFGSRLRAAREARDLDIETCAHALRLPARVLRQLERGEFDGLDCKIYLGSYIGKYSRHLGVDDTSIQAELGRVRQVEPRLVATGGISHSRFLLDRYATAATYVVLTAVIVVPMVWLGVRGTLDHNLTHLAPLDSVPVAQQDVPAPATSSKSLAVDAPATKSPLLPSIAAPTQDQPLLASMAPFPNMESGNSLAPPTAPVASAVDSGTGNHSLNLNLSAASWVEVTDPAGKRLEYGLLPAGSNKTYHSDQPLEVRVGNASGAQISIDGDTVGLEDFRHSNVAHFRMQIRDGKAAAASL
jgi:cytoskeleton protein RodZ